MFVFFATLVEAMSLYIQGRLYILQLKRIERLGVYNNAYGRLNLYAPELCIIAIPQLVLLNRTVCVSIYSMYSVGNIENTFYYLKQSL